MKICKTVTARVIVLLMTAVLITIPLAALSSDRITVTGEVNDNYQIVSNDGEIFEVADTEAGIDLIDNQIGQNLEDKQIFLGEGNGLHDVVVFEKAWGGNDDGCSLSRTGPFDPVTEEESWYPGADNGTPGEPNS